MIINGNWKVFLTLPNEKLLLVQRQHPFIFILPSFFIIVLAAFFIGSTFYVAQRFMLSYSLFIVTALLIMSIAISLVTKILIDWYFHLYIFTTRKILELRYTPLMSYLTNEVMLDRVSCTEIDLHTNGFLNEILDMGDVVITFDRPTHREDFALTNIQGSHAVSTFLTQQLLDINQPDEHYHPIWFKERQSSSLSY
jgi:hypothetical protein